MPATATAPSNPSTRLARLALIAAQQLARHTQWQVIDGETTSTLLGHPSVLESLCSYLGADSRGCQRWSVYLAPRARERMRVLMAAGEKAAN